MAQLTDDQVADAVAFLAQARARGGPLPAFPEACRPATIGDAYRIAQATRSPADTRPDGWKAGASSAAQMRDAGLATPPVAPLFPGVLCESPADLDGATYHLCIMEAEVAFRLAAGLPSRPAPYTMLEVRDAVAGAHLVIEAVNFPFADGPAVGLPSIVAGGFAVGSLVVGPSIDDWAARDLKTLDVELLIDGECVARGLEGDARCDPLGVLLAMANDLSARGFGLEAGQIVTTGAAAAPTPARPGQTAVVRVAGVGEVVARLATGA